MVRETSNGAEPASPVVPVTVTVYGPLGTDATVKDPDTAPPDTLHAEFEIRPVGDEEIVHVISAELNPEPEAATTIPGGPEVGDSSTVGVGEVPVIVISKDTGLGEEPVCLATVN